MLDICKKSNFGRLSEVVDVILPTILGKFQSFGGNFGFGPLKKFPQGGLWGTFDLLFPLNLHCTQYFPVLYKFPLGLTLNLLD